ncbi:MAG TPA: xanthine dehydrogenase accessory protein XdhC [Paracoccaceae bacterium]|nr:xanthine dehydrogenase accessory protein XdhC [Paracoccaceae bacterium]
MFDLDTLRAAVTAQGRVARIVVAGHDGSAPREAGAAMLVWENGQSGTIGGGALEWEAAARARTMLATGGARVDRMALGPALGQCCGGAVTLVTEVFAAQTLPVPRDGVVARAVTGGDMPLAVRRMLDRARAQGTAPATTLVQGWLVEPLARPLRQVWVWGAGHVGRALVGVLAPLPDLAITWVDVAPDRFPDALPAGVTVLPAADPAALVAHAPADAEHLILTFSHALDLDLCHRLLTHGFAACGLIGSATKWARFRSRLAALGHAPGHVARIACPIGDPALGKHPQAIAVGVAAHLLRARSAPASQENAG